MVSRSPFKTALISGFIRNKQTNLLNYTYFSVVSIWIFLVSQNENHVILFMCLNTCIDM